MHERDPERTVIEHDNGFTMVNTVGKYLTDNEWQIFNRQ
jgi:hypothetical protein